MVLSVFLPQGVGRMSRRRSSDPTESIRITIPRSIHHKILDVLEPSASRSAWISAACRDKLLESGGLLTSEASAKQLLMAFQSKCDEENIHVELMFWRILEEAVGLVILS